MSQSHESQKIARVHKYIPSTFIKWKIPGGMFGANGIPDCIYIGKTNGLFVEYKNQKAPKRKDTKIKPTLSELQKKAMAQLYNLNFPCLVIIFTDMGSIVMKSPQEWENGIKLEDATLIETYQQVADFIKGAITGDLQ